MKLVLNLLLLTLMFNVNTSYADEEDQHVVNCSIGGGCFSVSGATGSEIVTEKLDYTSFDFGIQNTKVNVKTPDNESPKNLRMNISFGEYPGKDLEIDLSSNNQESDAGSIFVIGDNIDTLNLKLNGYNGAKGKDASELCSEKFLNGSFGANALAFYNNRRSQDNSIPKNNCDSVDLNYLSEFNFYCDNSNFQPLEGSNPTIEVARIRTKARCSAVLVRDECVRKKRNVTCRYRQWGRYCAGSKGGYRCWNQHTGRTTYGSKIFPELWYFYERGRIGHAAFCERYVRGKPWSWTVTNIHAHPQTSPGLDSASGLPLPGSLWEHMYTQAYGSCPTHWEYRRTVFTNEIVYDENDNKCDDVGIISDPNNILNWTYLGMAQEPDFGTQLVLCSPNDCPLQSAVSELSHEITSVTPTNGKNGTQRGKAVFLVYDVENKGIEAVNGQAGAGGRNDLQTRETVRYCYNSRDADSDGILSDYAKDPNVNFRKYRWQPIRSAIGGQAGTPPNNPNTTIEIYTKISDSVRFLMRDSLL